MEDEKRRWDKFNRIKLDRRRLAKTVKRAEGTTTRHANRFVLKRINSIKLVRREIATWLLLVGAIIAGSGVQLLWGQANYLEKSPVASGSYVEGSLGPINTLNPLYASSSAEATVGRLVFSSLYNYDEGGTLRQDIATSMKIDTSGRLYNVTLRKDARWHDGVLLTSKDIIFTINLMKNPASRSPFRVNWLDVSAKAIDNNTVQFTLPATYAAFPHALTFPVMPEHILGSVSPATIRENIFSQSPVGSGPFRFKLLQSTDTVRNLKAVHLVANDDYYGGRPKLDRFEVHAYDNQDDILHALQVGELSGAADISITSKSSISSKQYDATPLPLASGTYLLINTIRPTLSDQKVRQALQLATDAKNIREAISQDVLPLDSPFVDGQLTGADVPRAPQFSLVRAAVLLEEAGWKLEGGLRKKDGKSLDLVITTTMSSENRIVVDIVAKQWRKLGLKVEVRTVDTASVSSSFIQDTLQGRNFDVLLYDLAIGSDPDVYAYWHSSQAGQTGYNFTSYSNKTADANLASARSRLEPELRNAKYKIFAKQWLEDVPAIALYQPVVEYISSTNSNTVKPGARLSTLTDRFANVLYWSVNSDVVYKTP